MAINLFSDFRNNNKVLPQNSNKKIQAVTQEKSDYKLAKILIPSAIGGTLAGSYTYFNQNKNVNMKYALFAKNELQKYLNDPIANTKCQGVPPFRSNPVSQYKALKTLIVGIDEDLPTCSGKAKLDLESLKILAKQLLNNHEARFLNIKSAFTTQFIKQNVLKTSLYSTAGLIAGAASGLLLSKFTHPNNTEGK